MNSVILSVEQHTSHNMSDNYVIVKIEEGSLRGEKIESVRGGNYYSFKGIPYGKPPVGDLRFKSPVPAEPWNGIRDALEHGHVSAAKVIFGKENEYDETSSEDCLFLNVYTPQVPQGNDKPKAVMVWIHGGAFMYGSGNSDFYGPDFLITEDVVLVTINYRLGALGFLSLATEDCPGNFGLKDCVLALKWVKRNISAFGGDPNNVTIFGESAGAGCVQHLLLSKLSKGLFHKAISQSGTSLDQWSIMKNPRDYAFALGEKLGCKTKDDKELLTFLKRVTPKDLVLAETDLFKTVIPDEVLFNVSFLPVVEPDHKDAFITKTPKEIFLNGDVHDVPYIAGANSQEGLWMYGQHKDYVKSTEDEELQKFIPKNLNIEKGSPEAKKFAKLIRDYYFPNGLNDQSVVDVHSRIMFINGLVKTSYLISKIKDRKSPTYIYSFSFSGNRNLLKSQSGFPDWKGATHGDDIGYLFYIAIQEKLVPGTPENLMVEKITKLWTDFAKTGNPTPKDNLWKPISQSKPDIYLDIGDELILKEKFEEEPNKVWHEIFKLAL